MKLATSIRNTLLQWWGNRGGKTEANPQFLGGVTTTKHRRKAAKATASRSRRPAAGKAVDIQLPFVALATHLATQNSAGRRPHTVQNYLTALNSFAHFLPSGDIGLRQIRQPLVASYCQWLALRHVGDNTQACYLRSLRSLYNMLAGRYRVRNSSPFAHAFTGNAPTAKRSVSLAVVQRLQQMALPAGSRLELSRDVFLFCLYAQGMPFADVARLTRQQIVGGTIQYRRRKTGQPVCVRLEPCLKAILNKYAREDSPMLFPLMSEADCTLGRQDAYHNALKRHNEALRELTRMAHSPIGLTSYVARHTWASMAFSHGVPVNTISQALGHATTIATRTYISPMENSIVARANRLVVRLLCKGS